MCSSPGNYDIYGKIPAFLNTDHRRDLWKQPISKMVMDVTGIPVTRLSNSLLNHKTDHDYILDCQKRWTSGKDLRSLHFLLEARGYVSKSRSPDSPKSPKCDICVHEKPYGGFWDEL